MLKRIFLNFKTSVTGIFAGGSLIATGIINHDNSLIISGAVTSIILLLSKDPKQSEPDATDKAAETK